MQNKIVTKTKLVISDLHLGKGRKLPNGMLNLLEDFLYDDRFAEFLEYYSTPPYHEAEIELILNGDILNLIQVDYRGHFTTVITEQVSAEKVASVIQGHPVFFDALKKFLANPKHSMTYVVGNHDQEMVWPTSRRLFDEAVGREITWKTTYHQVDGVHIEHGHQYEFANRVDPTKQFLTENLPEPILNLPWGTIFTVQYIIKLKMQKHFIDKVRPFRLMIRMSLMQDFFSSLLHGLRFLIYFISVRFSKNRYRHTNLSMTFKTLFSATVFPDLTDAARRILRTPNLHTVIFGHTHVYKHVPIGEAKQYLNTGTWIDITSLDLDNFAKRSKLTYVRIEYENNNQLAIPLLRHWIGRVPLEDDAMAM